MLFDLANPALTEEERHEMRECQRIIQFAKDINDGTHPHVTAQPHLRKLFGDPKGNEDLLAPAYTKHTKIEADIDYMYDYYKILCLDANATQEEIQARYKQYVDVHHPLSEFGRSRWLGKSDKYRQMAYRFWNGIRKAHCILTDDRLRTKYDTNRLGLQLPASSMPVAKTKQESAISVKDGVKRRGFKKDLRGLGNQQSGMKLL